MTKVVNDQYLAGLWRSQMPSTLLWSAEPNGPSSNFRRQKLPFTGDEPLWIRPRPLRAPTWSWISVDSAIAFFFPVAKKQLDYIAVEVLEAHVEPVPSDAERLDGYLRVRCPLYPVKLIYDRTTDPPTQALRIGDFTLRHGVFLDESPEAVGVGERLHLMPIFYRDYHERGKPPTQVRALILRPTGRVRGEFERFGLFTDWGNQVLEILTRAWGKEEEIEFEERVGEGRYIITIV
ncbi:hypothetical protein LTS18_006996 [Coniosporium uncinatum]|uniref:Uncharacterized protein n=1 Tax=Coniosporium uncinatum TaxID=93489 RepID=A0ACC3DPJ0_9PEZI|nr:hypothetical protein LTS18_006996 [Coniosporium uncinatum]